MLLGGKMQGKRVVEMTASGRMLPFKPICFAKSKGLLSGRKRTVAVANGYLLLDCHNTMRLDGGRLSFYCDQVR